MKKFFALTLAVVMVLAVASTAMAAFTWNAGAATTADSFANRYKIEVVKLANETGIIGTNKLIEAPGATAVNNASVYFYIKLTVSGSDTETPDAVQTNAKAKVSFTALNSSSSSESLPDKEIALTNLSNGVYYYNLASASDSSATTTDVWKTLPNMTSPNSIFSTAAIEGRVLDTATAKVYAKVSSQRPLDDEFEEAGYFIVKTGSKITFGDEAAKAGNYVEFTIDSAKKVTEVTASVTDANFVPNLYGFLGFSAADITAGKVYMTDDNLRAAFGFDYKGESSITWNANATAIILDPAIGVGIPKTGDNASVIGFAMVMIAVVGAAVAVKKVRA